MTSRIGRFRRGSIAWMAAVAILFTGLPSVSLLARETSRTSYGLATSSSSVNGGVVVSAPVSASRQDDRQRVRSERLKLTERVAELEFTLEQGRRSTVIGQRVLARLKRVLVLLEIPDLSLSERTVRFEQLGISRLYRGVDLVVKVRDSERTVRGLGAPVHPALHLQKSNVPDGTAPSRAADEWEQDWEIAQIEAEDTVVAIEGLESEAQGWVSDLEGYGGLSETGFGVSHLEGDEGATDGCATSGADVDSERNCITAVGAALAETLGAIAGYLGNKQVVRDALANARNAITVAMGAFTAGTLTASGLASAAISAITALAGSTAAGWFAAAAIAVATAVIIYEITVECLLPAGEFDGARTYVS